MKKKNIFSRYLSYRRNFGTIEPVSRVFGLERGVAIDRYYIEKFLLKNQSLIRGTVLEVGDSRYTRKFGGKKVEKSFVLNKNEGKSNVDFIADLETGSGMPCDLADCFIMTQTLLCTFDVNAAAKNALGALKSGGVILVTVPGITQISRFDYVRWGQYWSFTDLSLRKIFERHVPSENIIVETYGNVKIADAFLWGLALHEIQEKDLDYVDPDYQLVITGVIKK